MSDIIQLLPDSVANQIAAGEVIQRPASVIKELVENAVDAGAKTIHVLVVDAGRTSIQVIDDGKGMSETDARMSFERHATSKIRQASDLFDLHTMGFRGEALASIAAVAQVILKTRQANQEIGTQLTIAGSKYVGQEPVSCPVGSNFLVENLFYNVPARRKFLKSNTTELNNILTAFERIVLVYPEIHFTFHSNGTELYDLRQSNRRQRIVDLFGRKMNQDLLNVSVETSLCKISGFVGKPESARKKNAHQFFFVNGRYMKHPYFNKAVMSAFERLVPEGMQVPYYLYFDVDPKNIDVNIHPTKTEIKFENEQAIWQVLSAAVKEAVGMFSDVPTIDFDTEGKPEIPVYDPQSGAVAPKVAYNPSYNPFRDTPATSQPEVPDQWEQLYEGLRQGGQGFSPVSQDASVGQLFTSSATGQGKDDDQPSPADEERTATAVLLSDKAPDHYQYKGRYIMTAVKSGLMIIDQHRAHERILDEQYLRQLRQHTAETQKVLFPEVVTLRVKDQTVEHEILEGLHDLGFDLSNLGDGSFAVNGVPAGIEGLNPVRLVEDLSAAAVEKGTSVKEEIFEALASSLARQAAIPYGQILSNAEMENLVNQLFSCSNMNYTSDGKRILCILKESEMVRLLG